MKPLKSQRRLAKERGEPLAILRDGDGMPIPEFRWGPHRRRSGVWVGFPEGSYRVFAGVEWLVTDPITYRAVTLSADYAPLEPVDDQTYDSLAKAKAAAERYMAAMLVAESLKNFKGE